MKPHRVCRASEIPEGSHKVVTVEGRSIGIFNINGTYYALRNLCPHQFAPLCKGPVTGYNAPSAVGEFRWCKEGEIIRCPWHGWEFDITTGKSIFNPHKVRSKSYPVTLGDGGRCEEEAPSVESYPISQSSQYLFVHF